MSIGHFLATVLATPEAFMPRRHPTDYVDVIPNETVELVLGFMFSHLKQFGCSREAMTILIKITLYFKCSASRARLFKPKNVVS